ncbi:anti-sigma factor family protein [Bythopirellula goksoeyrii]|uniref:Putative zinc-finger domain-containing protein n=1 Tax=Bythopirellula goksoeyrii TaxID=1400387 RepID=A0A5B9QA80_9BACT|nr:zf-HC2 domain-containing protein [Bythopirellula goksoeyrii]QEG35788.1 hypothetical protein Pr1d_30940 [Bythopirellula goksoeyrii]
MNCSKVYDRLSAYHDSELSQEDAAQVAAHLAKCPTCTEELASYVRLSGLSRRLIDPPVPEQLWAELQSKLDTPTTSWKRIARHLPDYLPQQRLVLAASLLIAFGIGVLAYLNWSSHSEHNHLAMNFSHFLEEFEQRPEEAQQILLANYNGRQSTLQEVTDVLGYEPVAANKLPPEYRMDQVYLLDMPCCTCAQIVCKNKEGQSIAIFEHAIDQPVWFGDRPTVECLCHDIPTSVTQMGNRLAATWKEGQRFITIIGATDLDEVTEFIAHFKGVFPVKG